MNCVFCDIALGTVPAYKIYVDENVLIFLDKRPLFHGHCLLIPRIHATTISDLPKALLAPYFEKLQQITRVVELGMQSMGSFIAMNNTVSQSVPHLHSHIVPRNKGDGLKGFFWPRIKYTEEELATTQARLQLVWQHCYP